MGLRWNRPILISLPDSPLPTDYLVARVKGCSVHLIRYWQAYLRGPALQPDWLQQRFPGEVLGSEEPPWSMFYRELAWLYLRMNPNLRQRFGPLFSYWVLQLIVSGMRRLVQGQTTELYLHTAHLVDAPLYRILRHAGDAFTLLDQLQHHRFVESDDGTKLPAVLKAKGYVAVETDLLDALLIFVAPAARGFVGRLVAALIDIRNLRTLHKWRQWEAQRPPQWLPFGTIRKRDLQRVLQSAQPEKLAGLLVKSGWQLPDPGAEVDLEQQLLVQLTGKVRGWARENHNEAVLVRYLWDRYVESVNLAVIQRLFPAYSQRVAMEMIA